MRGKEREADLELALGFEGIEKSQGTEELCIGGGLVGILQCHQGQGDALTVVPQPT